MNRHRQSLACIALAALTTERGSQACSGGWKCCYLCLMLLPPGWNEVNTVPLDRPGWTRSSDAATTRDQWWRMQHHGQQWHVWRRRRTGSSTVTLLLLTLTRLRNVRVQQTDSYSR